MKEFYLLMKHMISLAIYYTPDCYWRETTNIEHAQRFKTEEEASEESFPNHLDKNDWSIIKHTYDPKRNFYERIRE